MTGRTYTLLGVRPLRYFPVMRFEEGGNEDPADVTMRTRIIDLCGFFRSWPPRVKAAKLRPTLPCAATHHGREREAACPLAGSHRRGPEIRNVHHGSGRLPRKTVLHPASGSRRSQRVSQGGQKNRSRKTPPIGADKLPCPK